MPLKLFFCFIIKFLSSEIKLSSYKNQTCTGEISLELKNKLKINNREIIIVEDIVDSGRTINYLYKYFKKFKPKNIASVALLNKYTINKNSTTINWIGFDIEDDFVVGYGLDYNQYFRGLPSIYKIINER